MEQAAGGRPLAVVTGASSGIGLEVARALAERGHDLVVSAEDAEIEAVPGLVGGPPGSVRAVRADLTRADGVRGLVDALGRDPDVLVLNAGVGVGGPFVRTPLEDDERLLALNVTALVRLAKLLVPGMVVRGRGRVLVTASIAGLMPGPWYATYAASKAFAHSFAQALRHELRDTGVTVTALLPGPTDTAFFRRAGMQRTVVAGARKDDPADVARDGVEALLAGRDQVISHGLRQRVQGALVRVLPDRVKAAFHAQLTRRARQHGGDRSS